MYGMICEYFRTNGTEYLEAVGEHLLLGAVSLAIAVAVGTAGALFCLKRKKAELWMSGIFQILRIIPSLAVLIILIPVMGTGVRPAVTALTLLAVPPVFMNLTAGFGEADAAVIETARGMGMTGKQIFRRIECPLALPMFLSGVKIAAVEIIASTALAAKIGAGGLGEIIFTGLGLNRTDLLLVGAVSTAVISIAVGMLLNAAEYVLVPYKRRKEKRDMKNWKKAGILILAGIVAFSTAACGRGESKGQDEKAVIRVGSKDFTESLIVSEIYSLALEDAGYEVERVQNIAGSVVHTSLVNDEIDLYPEYTGTGLLSILQMDYESDPQKVYDTVKEEYEKQFGLTWLEYSQANDAQGLMIRTEEAEKLGIRTISDLQKYASELRFASQGEFDEREDGLPALEAAYGAFEWKSSKVYDNGLKYEVLRNDEADVSPAYTTEGQLADTDTFMILEDDKQVWPPYNLAPVVRDDVLEENPEIADILNKVSETLTTEKITELNAKVDVDKMEMEEAAAEYWESLKASAD